MRCYKNDPQNNRGNNRANSACGVDGVSRSYGPGKKARGMENSRRASEGNTLWIHDATFCHFKWFVEERETIRKKKEAGEERPWTTDPILHRTHFTNIHRQDDKVSRYIFGRLQHCSGPLLVYNLLLSRLINRIDVLSKFLPTLPSIDLSFLLDGEGVVMNPKAYQISPGMVKLDNYETCRETIVYYTKKIYEDVFNAITSTTDLKEATELGNKAFGGSVCFVMYQVVLDYHYLTGHYDDNSNIFIGQGAKLILDTLGGLEFLSTELDMNKYDIEHAACEYRKYLYRKDKVLSRYSYKPGRME